MKRLFVWFALVSGVTLIGPVAQASAMQIFVSPVKGKRIALEVQASDLVEQVKAKIHDKSGILPENQVLVFASFLLADDRTLADYNIRKEATLQFFLKVVPPKIWLASPGRQVRQVWLHFHAWPLSFRSKIKNAVAKVDGHTVWSGAVPAIRTLIGGIRGGKHRLLLTVIDSRGGSSSAETTFSVAHTEFTG